MILPTGSIFRRVRLILDCFLVIALILAIILSSHPTQANTELQTTALKAQPANSQALHPQDTLLEPLDSDLPPTDGVTIDDNMLAALIAAENAALTLPQYLIGLPIIQR